jgi:hydrogenase-4 component F
MMIAMILFTPLILSIVIFIRKSKKIGGMCNVFYAAVLLAASLSLYFRPDSFSRYFGIDQVNILFLLILAVLYLGISVYNTEYIKQKEASAYSHAFYAIHLLLFPASMACVILSTHLGMLWVFVEATTLTSAYLIYFNHSDSSLEATWKYIFICSVGIALAFVGIIILSMGLEGGLGHSDSLFFDDLYKNAKLINPFWLKLSLSFILVGFGTKAGFAPVHAWLPDAHSESPSPVSALLSGALLNAALLGIIRVSKILKLAGFEWYVSNLLLLMGFLSLFISAVFIMRIENYKRMLAYSSIENMGIIAIGLGSGGPGIFAAMLHLTAHSFIKASLFLTSGNIFHRYRTKEISGVRGLLNTDKMTGWLWILFFIAIAGMPPFPLFLSEFFIAKSLLSNGSIFYTVLFFLLLTIILAAMGRSVLRMSFGESLSTGSISPTSERHGVVHPSIPEYLPQLIFLLMLIIMSALPGGFLTLLENAAAGL